MLSHPIAISTKLFREHLAHPVESPLAGAIPFRPHRDEVRREKLDVVAGSDGWEHVGAYRTKEAATATGR